MADLRQAIADAHGIQLHGVALVPPGTVPRTTSGKLQRFLCRDAWLNCTLEPLASGARQDEPGVDVDGKQLPDSSRPSGVTICASRNSCASSRSPIDATTRSLTAYGIDSLGALELVAALEDRFECTLPESLLTDCADLRPAGGALGRRGARDMRRTPRTASRDPARPHDRRQSSARRYQAGVACEARRAGRGTYC